MFTLYSNIYLNVLHVEKKMSKFVGSCIFGSGIVEQRDFSYKQIRCEPKSQIIEILCAILDISNTDSVYLRLMKIYPKNMADLSNIMHVHL